MPFNLPSFNPQIDNFCLTLHTYTNDPTSYFKQQALIHAIATLNPLDFYACDLLTDQTRLMYLVTALAHNRMLYNNLFIVQYFLARSEHVHQTAHFDLPHITAFLLLTPDVSGVTLYQWTLHFKKPEFTQIIENAQVNLMEQGVLMPAPELNHYLEKIWQLHFDLLNWEYKQGKKTADSYTLELKRLQTLQTFTSNITQNNATTRTNVLWLLFDHKTIHRHRLLDRLLQPDVNPKLFYECLIVLKDSVKNKLISTAMYQELLTQSPIPGRSLLHELLYRRQETDTAKQDAKNLDFYLHAINQLRGSGQLSHQAYLALFTAENKSGYSVMHQGINTPHFIVAETFLSFFRHNSFFSASDQYLLINYKSRTSRNPQPGATRIPRRNHYDENDSISQYLASWRKNLSYLFQRKQEEPTVPKLSERGKNTFYPTITTDEKEQDWISTWTPTSSPIQLKLDDGIKLQAFDGPS